MKIKNKLIAGGLMSVVACALVGSITGTFAWYQYSNSGTVSMHGVSVGASQNLEFKLDKDGESFAPGNLVWSKIKTLFTQDTAQDKTKQLDTDGNFKLSPVSNGANTGSDDLAATWYGNPDGSQDVLPVVTSGYMQFSFYARIAETEDGTNYTYPQGKIYVTDIAGVAAKMDYALRMHVDFGAKQFVVNPAKAGTASQTEDVTLQATLSKATKYDWQETGTDSSIVYELPIDTTAGNPGTLKALAHEDVKAKNTGTDNALVNEDYFGVIPGTEAGLKITVTLWLEGFAVEPNDNNEQTTEDNWWDMVATVGDQIKAGFELTGVKD